MVIICLLIYSLLLLPFCVNILCWFLICDVVFSDTYLRKGEFVTLLHCVIAVALLSVFCLLLLVDLLFKHFLVILTCLFRVNCRETARMNAGEEWFN